MPGATPESPAWAGVSGPKHPRNTGDSGVSGLRALLAELELESVCIRFGRTKVVFGRALDPWTSPLLYKGGRGLSIRLDYVLDKTLD